MLCRQSPPSLKTTNGPAHRARSTAKAIINVPRKVSGRPTGSVLPMANAVARAAKGRVVKPDRVNLVDARH